MDILKPSYSCSLFNINYYCKFFNNCAHLAHPYIKYKINLILTNIAVTFTFQSFQLVLLYYIIGKTTYESKLYQNIISLHFSFFWFLCSFHHTIPGEFHHFCFFPTFPEQNLFEQFLRTNGVPTTRRRRRAKCKTKFAVQFFCLRYSLCDLLLLFSFIVLILPTVFIDY